MTTETPWTWVAARLRSRCGDDTAWWRRRPGRDGVAIAMRRDEPELATDARPHDLDGCPRPPAGPDRSE